MTSINNVNQLSNYNLKAIECSYRSETSWFRSASSYRITTSTIKKVFVFALALFALFTIANACGEFYGTASIAPSQACASTLPVRMEFPQYKENNQKITNDELVQKFERGATLGQGGDGQVCIVRERETKRHYALRLGSKTNYTHIGKIVDYIKDTGISPHFTAIYNSYNVTTKCGVQRPFPSWGINTFNSPSPNFFKEESRSQREKCEYEVTVMELMRGNFLQVYSRNSPSSYLHSEKWSAVEELAFRMQTKHAQEMIEAILNIKVIPDDNGPRNQLYKELDDNDCFRGYQLNAFEYWKITIEGRVFYIPRPKHLYKMGDYGQLIYKYVKARQLPNSCVFESDSVKLIDLTKDNYFTGTEEITPEKLKSLFLWMNPPPINATVLNLDADCLHF